MKHTTANTNTAAQVRHLEAHMDHWDAVARRMDTWTGWGGYYHRRLTEVYRFLVAPGQRVLEIGCGQGELLAALDPAVGVGVDLSPEMIRRAEQRYPQLCFVTADAHTMALEQAFDVIILSDLVNDLWDVQTVFERLHPLTTPRTRLILNFYSRVWEAPLTVAARLGLAKPILPQNWLTVEDIVNLLNLTNFDVIRHWEEILCPVPLPLIEACFNRYAVKLWPLKMLALTNFILARPRVQSRAPTTQPLVSVIVPARNEAGNIAQIFNRTPEMGRGTELVFVEGHSRDDTYAVIEQLIATHPERRCQLLRQTGVGKGDAVRLGFAHASGEILMILDADLTVPPEDLPRFYEALCDRQGRVYQRGTPGVPVRKTSHAVLQSAWEQILQPGLFVVTGTANQRYPVWHEGAVEIGLRAHCCQSYILWGF